MDGRGTSGPADEAQGRFGHLRRQKQNFSRRHGHGVRHEQCLAREQRPGHFSWPTLGVQPVPDVPFRILQVLRTPNNSLMLVESAVERVQREITFKNDAFSVAIRLAGQTGDSGSPVLDLADGRLVGMLIGGSTTQPGLAAVIPASVIYRTLTESK